MKLRVGFGSSEHRLLERIEASNVRSLNGQLVARISLDVEQIAQRLAEAQLIQSVKPQRTLEWVTLTQIGREEIARLDGEFERRVLAGQFFADGNFTLHDGYPKG